MRFVRVAALALSLASVDCQCGKKSAADGASSALALSVPSVYELSDARALGDNVLVRVRTQYVPEQRMATELALSLTAKGKERWRSAPGARVLLGPSTTSPVFVIDAPPTAKAAERRVIQLDPATGREQRSFVLPRGRTLWDTWIRDDDTLFLIDSENSDESATLAMVDANAGTVTWSNDTRMALDTNHSSGIPAPIIVTPSAVHVFCKEPGSHEYGRGICRFSRTDGLRTKTFAAPVQDAARSAESKRLFVLRNSELEAFTDEGEPLWKQALPENFYGKRVVAGADWVVVIASWVRKKDSHDEAVIALDASDGHPLWKQETTGGGEHYGSELALGGDRVVFISNITPQIRVVNRRGVRVLGAPLETKFVVSTEVVGGFVESLFGEVILTPSLLLLARGNGIGLQGYRLP